MTEIEGIWSSIQTLYNRGHQQEQNIEAVEKHIHDLKLEKERLEACLAETGKVNNYLVVREDDKMVGISSRRRGAMFCGCGMTSLGLIVVLLALVISVGVRDVKVVL